MPRFVCPNNQCNYSCMFTGANLTTNHGGRCANCGYIYGATSFGGGAGGALAGAAAIPFLGPFALLIPLAGAVTGMVADAQTQRRCYECPRCERTHCDHCCIRQ